MSKAEEPRRRLEPKGTGSERPLREDGSCVQGRDAMSPPASKSCRLTVSGSSPYFAAFALAFLARENPKGDCRSKSSCPPSFCASLLAGRFIFLEMRCISFEPIPARTELRSYCHCMLLHRFAPLFAYPFSVDSSVTFSISFPSFRLSSRPTSVSLNTHQQASTNTEG